MATNLALDPRLTGLVRRELPHGFNGPSAGAAILQRFKSLDVVAPDQIDPVAAAEVRRACRRAEVQIATIDARLIQFCGRHELTLLSTDHDFVHTAQPVPFKLWRSPTADSPAP